MNWTEETLVPERAGRHQMLQRPPECRMQNNKIEQVRLVVVCQFGCRANSYQREVVTANHQTWLEVSARQ